MTQPPCMRLVAVITVALVYGCVSPRERYGPNENRIEQMKDAIVDSSVNKKIRVVEDTFGLGLPFASRAPTKCDPMWWFAYDKDELRVEISANYESDDIDNGIPGQAGYWFAGYVWVGPADSRGSGRLDVIPRRSLKVCWRGPETPANRYSEYLNTLDMSNPLTIADVERALELGEPINVEGPAFIDPVVAFFYEQEGHVVRLLGNPNCSVEFGEWREHRDQVPFTGLWCVGEVDDPSSQ